MAVIGVDLGGTKIASGIFEHGGELVTRRTAKLTGGGDAVGDLIISEVGSLLSEMTIQPDAVGVSVPGIFYSDRGTVWAPNIPGWTDYPLVERLEIGLGGNVSVCVDSDRACYVLGEEWQGRARGCRNVIFVAVGTGIGAGILIDGRVLRGAVDAAGAIGWMGLDRPYRDVYDDCGCFEYHASGAGIAKVARELLTSANAYDGVLSEKPADDLTAVDVLIAEADGDRIAIQVMDDCIEFWAMAVANLVSLFNPEMIILGGGVFESAARFLPRIRAEATRWAQPISIGQVIIETSALGADAGLYGAARLALSEMS